MPKLCCLCLFLLIFLNPNSSDRERLTRYPKLDVYEIRPGTMMQPRFTANDEFCEVGLERLNYTPDLIRVNPSFSRNEIDQIVDELAPADQRGKLSDSPTRPLVTIAGNTSTMTLNFENVAVDISGPILSSNRKNYESVYTVATIKWKKRVCR
jgi:hypothetical protein